MLCAPIIDNDTCIGAIQCINKKEGELFSKRDEERVESLTRHIAIAVRQCTKDLAQEKEKKSMKEKLKQQSLLSQLSDDLVVDDEAELLKAVAACVSKLIHAERTTLWIVDGDELYSILNEGVSDSLRIPKTSGIAGHCATFG